MYIFLNTNTGLMIKKINKKYTLTCISIKKYTLTCINDKKINKKYTLTCINDKKDQ